MSGLQRYSVGGSDLGATLDPGPAGDLVLFADVEEALKDSGRLRWLMPVLQGDDDRLAMQRAQALSAGLLLGKSGMELVDFAMGECLA